MYVPYKPWNKNACKTLERKKRHLALRMQNIFLPKLMGLQEGTTELFVHVGVHPVFGRDKLKGTKKKKKTN